MSSKPILVKQSDLNYGLTFFIVNPHTMDITKHRVMSRPRLITLGLVNIKLVPFISVITDINGDSIKESLSLNDSGINNPSSIIKSFYKYSDALDYLNKVKDHYGNELYIFKSVVDQVMQFGNYNFALKFLDENIRETEDYLEYCLKYLSPIQRYL